MKKWQKNITKNIKINLIYFFNFILKKIKNILKIYFLFYIKINIYYFSNYKIYIYNYS